MHFGKHLSNICENLYSLRIAKNLSLGKNMLEFSEKSLSLARSLSLFRLEFSEKCWKNKPGLSRVNLSSEKSVGCFIWAVLKFLHYYQGSYIPIIIDITANHQGYMEFKMCANNDIFLDPDQRCFDSSPALKVGNPEEEPSLKGLVANSIRLCCPFYN